VALSGSRDAPGSYKIDYGNSGIIQLAEAVPTAPPKKNPYD
jgi:hypothetical protein